MTSGSCPDSAPGRLLFLVGNREVLEVLPEALPKLSSFFP